MGFDACENENERLLLRKKNVQLRDRLEALIAEILDDPLILDGAPPGIGWFERAEEAIGRPVGSSFQKAINRKREALCNWCGCDEPCLPRPDCGHPKAQ